jgi:hypothetical protein
MAGAFTVFGTNDFVNLTVLVTGTLQDPGAATVRVVYSVHKYK